MNAFMNIKVRIITAEARARIKELEGEIRRMERTTRSTGMGSRQMGQGFAAAMTSGTKLGNQLQWTGRQLQYNFAMPIALAGAAATKFALDNERAMVRVKKVYGGAGQEISNFNGEIKALERNFRALSDHFGVHQAEVIGIAGDWAAAGASGVALAKATRLTLETMVLGEMQAAEATEALLAVQGQYNLSIGELSKAMDTLNMIENETDTNMQQLITSMARASGTARQAGVSVQELAAMTAALVPEAGQAANAGNGLKTMISRLLSPTEDAAAVLGKMGLSMEDLDWQSLNVTQRFQALADEFIKLPEGQRAVVGEFVAGRYQISRFGQLLTDVADRNGDFHMAMKVSGDEVANYRQRVRELNAVLESNPQKVKQVGVMIQNALADAILPLIPAITFFAQKIAQLARAFADLDPRIQLVIGVLLAWLMVFGPLLRYMGSSITMLASMGHMFRYIGTRATGAFVAVLRFAALPFTRIASGFMLIGKAAVGAGGLIVAAFAGPVRAVMAIVRANVAVGMAIVKGIWMKQWLLMRASFLIIMSPLVGAWRRMVTGLIVVWGTTMQMMAPIMSRIRAAVVTIWSGMWLAMTAIARARQAGIVATALTLHIAWATITSGMAALWAAMTSFWVVATSQGAGAIQRIWAFLVVASRAAGALIAFGLTAPFLKAAALIRGIGPAILVGIKAIPGAIMRLGPLVLKGFMKIFPIVFRFLTSWVGLILTALLGVAYAFQDQLVAAWNGAIEGMRGLVSGIAANFQPLVEFFDQAVKWVTDAFWSLPKGVRDAMLAVVKVVAWAAQEVYELFSYLNPWARHSPSLVESVTSGADAILAQYARLSSVGGLFAKAVKDLAAFKQAAANLGIDEWSDKRIEVAENIPQMLPLFNTMVGNLRGLNVELARQDAVVRSQEGVVAKWKASLDEANASLDRQRDELDRLETVLGDLRDQYSQHESAMQDYASAPLAGMRAMSDEIFANEMAQKRLQLQMMEWEEANGPLEDYRNRLAALQGDIEMIRGEAADLRSAGAGSDVLGPINTQIAEMEAAAAAMEGSIANSPAVVMQTELERLQRQGEKLALQQSLTFDPLTRAIEQAADMSKELTFEEAVAGVNRERAAMEALQPAIDAATAAVARQQAAVDQATAARDAINARYDQESARLDVLQDQYRETESLVRDIESALNDMGSAAQEAGERARKAKGPAESWAVEKFDANAAADFADVGGSGNIPREFPDITDQSAMIDQLTKDLQAETGKLFGSMDFIGPIKNAWNTAWTWVQENVGPYVEPVVGRVQEAWGGVTEAFGSVDWEGVLETITNKLEPVTSFLSGVWDGILAIWRLIEPDVRRIFDKVVEIFTDIWKELGPEVAKWGELFKPALEAVKNVFEVLKPIIQVALGVLLSIIKVGLSIIGHTIGPIFDTIIGVVTNVFQVIRGVVQVILAVLTGDWKMALEGLYNIFAGTFGAIWALIEGVVRTVIGIVWGFVSGIIGFFKWLWDELVGHSIVPDIVNGIIEVFGWLWSLAQDIWDNVLKPLYDFFVDAQELIFGTVGFLVSNIFVILGALWSLAKWIWDNVLWPVISAVINMWSGKGGVKDVITAMKDGFWKIIEGLIGLPKALWDNVLKPIWQNFTDLVDKYIKPLVNSFIRLIAGLGNNIGEGIARGINIGIKAVNALIGGLNWIGSNVPGLDFKINTIGEVSWSNWTPPQFARGGRLPTSAVDGGGRVNGPRAIVGEGRRGFPEFVIPTDPRYRNRARSFLFEAAGTVAPELHRMMSGAGLGGAIGGWWEDVKGAAGVVKDSAGNAVDFVRRGAVTAAFAAPLKMFDETIGRMANRPEPMRDMLMKKKNDFYNWAKGVDEALPKTPPPGVVGNLSVGGTGWANIENWLAANSNVRRYITSTFRPGDPGNHGSGRAIDYSVPGHGNRGYNDPGLRAIFNALLPVAGTLRELILAGAPFNIKHGQKVAPYASGTPGSPGNHWNHVHAAARNGALVRRTVGGRLIRVGEGSHDEAIVPLPPGMRTPFGEGGKKEVHFHSPTLVFPNIRNEEDAEAFVRNLSDLAG